MPGGAGTAHAAEELRRDPMERVSGINRDVLPVSLLIQPTEFFDPLVRYLYSCSLWAVGAIYWAVIVLGSHVILAISDWAS